MMSLTCRNIDLGRAKLDLVRCGCSSNGSFFAKWVCGGNARKSRTSKVMCSRRWNAYRCGALSAQTPETVFNVVAQDAETAFDAKSKTSSPILVSSLLEVVADDLLTLNKNLKSIVGAENPVLISAAEQIFGAGGKRLRPALVFLVSRATADLANLNELTPKHRRLAEVIEMIHTASLIHDDVLDDSSIRRGKETIHQLFGTRVAVLAGDFMFAQSSWYLANLENIEVIKLISQVIKDFASGEIKQASSLFDCDVTLEDYLMKSYYKTASLIAASSKCAAILTGVGSNVCEQMFEFGKNLGLSFQVVDDILDFTQSAEQLGKPAGNDLEKGNLTAPVIFALEKEPKLREIIDSEFTESGSLADAVDLIVKCGGIERAQDLAKEKAELAIESLKCLPLNEFRASLEGLVRYNLERID
ncbi:hypothetical protein Scep_012079 [Stephania cephalantha]|uniref:Solanesyl diphosphate synthase n=1 Tax=Stephania cephalantha TaxID=152367 RepID=A0AAP0P9J1_9MAGN